MGSKKDADDRINRPQTVEGMPVDEFIRRNADPIWLHQEGMWERMDECENHPPYFAPAPGEDKNSNAESLADENGILDASEMEGGGDAEEDDDEEHASADEGDQDGYELDPGEIPY